MSASRPTSFGESALASSKTAVFLLSSALGEPFAQSAHMLSPNYGTCRYAEGATLTGRRFVLVEDVVTSGGAILDALSLLEADGLRPEAALCVIDRGSGGGEALARLHRTYGTQPHRKRGRKSCRHRGGRDGCPKDDGDRADTL